MDCFQTNFHKDGTMTDGLRTPSKSSTNHYHYNNRDKETYVKEIEDKQMLTFD